MAPIQTEPPAEVLARVTNPWEAPVRSLGARAISAPIAALAALTTAHIAIRSLGADGYAVFALITGLAALLPFADLGIGAAVMDSAARRDSRNPGELRHTFSRSFRLLTLLGLCLAILAWFLAALGQWSVILGTPRQARTEIAVAVALTLFAAGLPMSLGLRLLAGYGKNHLVIVIQTAIAALTTCLALIGALFNAQLLYYSGIQFVSTLTITSWITIRERRKLPAKPRGIERPSTLRHESTIIHVAAPMLVITIVLPLAFQTDRLFLSHLSTLDEVAIYSVAYQIYAPLMGIAGSTAIALWPIFAKRDQATASWDVIKRVMFAFGVLGLFLGLALALLGPSIAKQLSGNAIILPQDIFVAFALLLLIQCVSYPLAMYLTDPESLWFQARWHMVMLSINVPLTVLTIPSLGAAGPVWASLVAVGCSLLGPELVRVRRMSRGKA